MRLKALFFFSMLFFASLLKAQKTDAHDSLATERSKDNQRETESIYRKGKLISETVFDVSYGKAKLSEKHFLDGKPEGVFRNWTNNVLRIEGAYHKGLRHGHYTEWYADGTKWLEYDYANGNLSGQRKEFDNAGHLVLSSFYRNGVYDSLYTKYYDNGKKEAEWICRDGLFEGKFTESYRNGKIAQEGIYRNDNREGEFTYYDSLGRPNASATYAKGELNGPYLEWYTGDGDVQQLKLKQQFLNDSAVGALRAWNKNGLRLYVPHDAVTYPVYTYYYYQWYHPLQEADSGVSFDELERRADSAVKALGDYSRQPVFPGGEKALHDSLMKSITYPQEMANTGRPASYKLSFLVGADGHVTDVRIVSGPEGLQSLSDNLINAVKKLPRWQPARRNGASVSFRDEISFNFVLQ